jgi:hypothetical protein
VIPVHGGLRGRGRRDGALVAVRVVLDGLLAGAGRSGPDGVGHWQAVLGRPPSGEEVAADPRRLVAEAVSYLGHNVSRMDHPSYRRQGLPTTSSLVESLVGEFNARVKGPQKVWNRPRGAESILQVRAALLSEDGRPEQHFARRYGCPYRRRPGGFAPRGNSNAFMTSRFTVEPATRGTAASPGASLARAGCTRGYR